MNNANLLSRNEIEQSKKSQFNEISRGFKNYIKELFSYVNPINNTIPLNINNTIFNNISFNYNFDEKRSFSGNFIQKTTSREKASDTWDIQIVRVMNPVLVFFDQFPLHQYITQLTGIYKTRSWYPELEEAIKSGNAFLEIKHQKNYQLKSFLYVGIKSIIEIDLREAKLIVYFEKENPIEFPLFFGSKISFPELRIDLDAISLMGFPNGINIEMKKTPSSVISAIFTGNELVSIFNKYQSETIIRFEMETIPLINIIFSKPDKAILDKIALITKKKIPFPLMQSLFELEAQEETENISRQIEELTKKTIRLPPIGLDSPAFIEINRQTFSRPMEVQAILFDGYFDGESGYCMDDLYICDKCKRTGVSVYINHAAKPIFFRRGLDIGMLDATAIDTLSFTSIGINSSDEVFSTSRAVLFTGLKDQNIITLLYINIRSFIQRFFSTAIDWGHESLVINSIELINIFDFNEKNGFSIRYDLNLEIFYHEKMYRFVNIANEKYFSAYLEGRNLPKYSKPFVMELEETDDPRQRFYFRDVYYASTSEIDLMMKDDSNQRITLEAARAYGKVGKGKDSDKLKTLNEFNLYFPNRATLAGQASYQYYFLKKTTDGSLIPTLTLDRIFQPLPGDKENREKYCMYKENSDGTFLSIPVFGFFPASARPQPSTRNEELLYKVILNQVENGLLIANVEYKQQQNPSTYSTFYSLDNGKTFSCSYNANTPLSAGSIVDFFNIINGAEQGKTTLILENIDMLNLLGISTFEKPYKFMGAKIKIHPISVLNPPIIIKDVLDVFEVMGTEFINYDLYERFFKTILNKLVEQLKPAITAGGKEFETKYFEDNILPKLKYHESKIMMAIARYIEYFTYRIPFLNIPVEREPILLLPGAFTIKIGESKPLKEIDSFEYQPIKDIEQINPYKRCLLLFANKDEEKVAVLLEVNRKLDLAKCVPSFSGDFVIASIKHEIIDNMLLIEGQKGQKIHFSRHSATDNMGNQYNYIAGYEFIAVKRLRKKPEKFPFSCDYVYEKEESRGALIVIKNDGSLFEESDLGFMFDFGTLSRAMNIQQISKEAVFLNDIEKLIFYYEPGRKPDDIIAMMKNLYYYGQHRSFTMEGLQFTIDIDFASGYTNQIKATVIDPEKNSLKYLSDTTFFSRHFWQYKTTPLQTHAFVAPFHPFANPMAIFTGNAGEKNIELFMNGYLDLDNCASMHPIIFQDDKRLLSPHVMNDDFLEGIDSLLTVKEEITTASSIEMIFNYLHGESSYNSLLEKINDARIINDKVSEKFIAFATRDDDSITINCKIPLAELDKCIRTALMTPGIAYKNLERIDQERVEKLFGPANSNKYWSMFPKYLPYKSFLENLPGYFASFNNPRIMALYSDCKAFIQSQSPPFIMTFPHYQYANDKILVITTNMFPKEETVVKARNATERIMKDHVIPSLNFLVEKSYNDPKLVYLRHSLTRFLEFNMTLFDQVIESYLVGLKYGFASDAAFEFFVRYIIPGSLHHRFENCYKIEFLDNATMSFASNMFEGTLPISNVQPFDHPFIGLKPYYFGALPATLDSIINVNPGEFINSGFDLPFAIMLNPFQTDKDNGNFAGSSQYATSLQRFYEYPSPWLHEAMKIDFSNNTNLYPNDKRLITNFFVPWDNWIPNLKRDFTKNTRDKIKRNHVAKKLNITNLNSLSKPPVLFLARRSLLEYPQKFIDDYNELFINFFSNTSPLFDLKDVKYEHEFLGYIKNIDDFKSIHDPSIFLWQSCEPIDFEKSTYSERIHDLFFIMQHFVLGQSYFIDEQVRPDNENPFLMLKKIEPNHLGEKTIKQGNVIHGLHFECELENKTICDLFTTPGNSVAKIGDMILVSSQFPFRDASLQSAILKKIVDTVNQNTRGIEYKTMFQMMLSPELTFDRVLQQSNTNQFSLGTQENEKFVTRIENVDYKTIVVMDDEQFNVNIKNVKPIDIIPELKAKIMQQCDAITVTLEGQGTVKTLRLTKDEIVQFKGTSKIISKIKIPLESVISAARITFADTDVISLEIGNDVDHDESLGLSINPKVPRYKITKIEAEIKKEGWMLANYVDIIVQSSGNEEQVLIKREQFASQMLDDARFTGKLSLASSLIDLSIQELNVDMIAIKENVVHLQCINPMLMMASTNLKSIETIEQKLRSLETKKKAIPKDRLPPSINIEIESLREKLAKARDEEKNKNGKRLTFMIGEQVSITRQDKTTIKGIITRIIPDFIPIKINWDVKLAERRIDKQHLPVKASPMQLLEAPVTTISATNLKDLDPKKPREEATELSEYINKSPLQSIDFTMLPSRTMILFTMMLEFFSAKIASFHLPFIMNKNQKNAIAKLVPEYYDYGKSMYDLVNDTDDHMYPEAWDRQSATRDDAAFEHGLQVYRIKQPAIGEPLMDDFMKYLKGNIEDPGFISGVTDRDLLIMLTIYGQNDIINKNAMTFGNADPPFNMLDLDVIKAFDSKEEMLIHWLISPKIILKTCFNRHLIWDQLKQNNMMKSFASDMVSSEPIERRELLSPLLACISPTILFEKGVLPLPKSIQVIPVLNFNVLSGPNIPTQSAKRFLPIIFALIFKCAAMNVTSDKNNQWRSFPASNKIHPISIDWEGLPWYVEPFKEESFYKMCDQVGRMLLAFKPNIHSGFLTNLAAGQMVNQFTYVDKLKIDLPKIEYQTITIRITSNDVIMPNLDQLHRSGFTSMRGNYAIERDLWIYLYPQHLARIGEAKGKNKSEVGSWIPRVIASLGPMFENAPCLLPQMTIYYDARFAEFTKDARFARLDEQLNLDYNNRSLIDNYFTIAYFTDRAKETNASFIDYIYALLKLIPIIVSEDHNQNMRYWLYFANKIREVYKDKKTVDVSMAMNIWKVFEKVMGGEIEFHLRPLLRSRFAFPFKFLAQGILTRREAKDVGDPYFGITDPLDISISNITDMLWLYNEMDEDSSMTLDNFLSIMLMILVEIDEPKPPRLMPDVLNETIKFISDLGKPSEVKKEEPPLPPREVKEEQIGGKIELKPEPEEEGFEPEPESTFIIQFEPPLMTITKGNKKPYNDRVTREMRKTNEKETQTMIMRGLNERLGGDDAIETSLFDNDNKEYKIIFHEDQIKTDDDRDLILDEAKSYLDEKITKFIAGE